MLKHAVSYIPSATERLVRLRQGHMAPADTLARSYTLGVYTDQGVGVSGVPQSSMIHPAISETGRLDHSDQTDNHSIGRTSKDQLHKNICQIVKPADVDMAWYGRPETYI